MTDFQRAELTRIAGALEGWAQNARQRQHATELTGYGEPWQFTDSYSARQAEEIGSYATQIRELL